MKFLADRTVGRLARYLRMLGHDTAWDARFDAQGLLSRAAAEGRTLLTRDTLLVQRRAVRRGVVQAVLVRDDQVVDQLKQLRGELGLHREGPSRCLVCNASLQELSPAAVKDRVPPYVAATQASFRYCPVCDRITWAATHWEDMERRLREAGFA